MSLREDMVKMRRPLEKVLESDYITISELGYFKGKDDLTEHLKAWRDKNIPANFIENRWDILDL